MKKLGFLAMALCLSMFVAGCEEKKAEKPKAGGDKAGAAAKEGDKGATHEPAEGAKGTEKPAH